MSWKAPGSFLDIGSANLNLLKNIVNLGWQLTLVEPGPQAEQLSKSLQCVVHNRPFEECSFSVQFQAISMIDVLEHVHSPVVFLKKVSKILSPNGVALLRLPNSRSIRCGLEREKWNMVRPLGHFCIIFRTGRFERPVRLLS